MGFHSSLISMTSINLAHSLTGLYFKDMAFKDFHLTDCLWVKVYQKYTNSSRKAMTEINNVMRPNKSMPTTDSVNDMLQIVL